MLVWGRQKKTKQTGCSAPLWTSANADRIWSSSQLGLTAAMYVPGCPIPCFGEFIYSTNTTWRKVRDVVCSSHLSCLKTEVLHQAYATQRRNVIFIYATKKESHPIPKFTQNIFTNATLGVHNFAFQPVHSKRIHWVVRHISAEVSTIAHSTQFRLFRL